MVKKSAKTPSLKPLDVVEAPEWVATGMLDSKDSNSSLMKDTKLEEIKMLFNDDVEFVIPVPTIGADWFRKGWVCFYYYPFEIGLRLPFSKLVVDVLTVLDVAPGQLMPAAWRILACLDAIQEKHKLGIIVDVVRHCYVTKRYNGCRCGLASIDKRNPLVLSLEVVNDRGWKEDVLFAEKANLKEDGAFLREQWNKEEFSLGPIEDVSKAASIMEKIMALPVQDRLWPNCLGRAIRNASPINMDEYLENLGKAVVKYDTITSEKSVVKSAAARTRSKRAMTISSLLAIGSPSKSVMSVSSESDDDPKVGKGPELSVGRHLATERK